MDYFQNSIAQEDVKFVTSIVNDAVVGDNFSKLMVFIEATKHVADVSAFATVSGDIKEAVVTASTYASVTKGLLKSWLSDFFAAQATANVHLVTVSADLIAGGTFDDADLIEAYGLLKAKAYWKTILITVPVDSVETLVPTAFVALAELCDADKGLSSPVLAPMSTATPATLSSDPVYAALTAASCDAFVVYHADATRHGGLVQLGLSLSVANASGTPVGNSFDYASTNVIDASGANGAALSVTVQNILKAAHISYFKYVGEPNGTVALIGASSIKGNLVPADWVVAYCNYCSSVYVAQYITKLNRFRDNKVYQGILLITRNTIQAFVESGRLSGLVITAPSFDKLPAGTDTIVVPNAWTAVYNDNVREVQVYGELTIGV